MTTAPWLNRLYYGDNLDVIRKHIPSASVDLVYLDPPFNSNRNYNVIFGKHAGNDDGAAAQIQAFGDTWTWTPATDEQYMAAVSGGTAARAARPSPGVPAQRSPSALAKDATKVTAEGGPVHSLATLLDDLATIAANRIQPVGGLPAFTVITTPTPVQRRALELLGVSHRLGYA